MQMEQVCPDQAQDRDRAERIGRLAKDDRFGKIEVERRAAQLLANLTGEEFVIAQGVGGDVQLKAWPAKLARATSTSHRVFEGFRPDGRLDGITAAMAAVRMQGSERLLRGMRLLQPDQIVDGDFQSGRKSA